MPRMCRILFFVMATALLTMATVSAAAAQSTLEVSPATALTNNQDYDRNPSVLYDGTDYWLFYTKADQAAPAVRGSAGYDPDADSYVVYYKQAATIAGLTAAAETQLALSQSARPAGFDQRVVSAALLGGHIYAFVSSGQSGTDRGLYYYDYDGSTWSGPTSLIADATARGGHVNVASDASRIYIVWESSDGTADCYTWDGVTLSAKVDISNANMPKITILSGGAAAARSVSASSLALGVLFVAGIEDGTGDIEVFSAVASPSPLFNPHSTAISGSGYYDPCIFNDGNDLYVISAPWVATDRQYLVQARFDGGTSTWQPAHSVSFGGYGTTEWWDYWPCGFFDGADAWIFFTTEAGNPTLSDADIATIRMDWDLTHDHYFYIQNAVDQASSGDIVNVAAGTYVEQVVLDKDLSLQGAGAGLTVIQSPAVLTQSFVSGPYTNYPVVYAHDVAAADMSDLTIDGAGLGKTNSRFTGAGYRNAGGTIDAVTITGIRNTPIDGSQHGVGIYALADNGTARTLTVSNCTIDDFQKNGTAFIGADLTAHATGNTVTGAGAVSFIAQNGIQLSGGATGSVTGNTVTGFAYTPATWAATGLLFQSAVGSIVTSDNSVGESQVGIWYIDTQGDIEENDVTNTVAGMGATPYWWCIVADPGEGARPQPPVAAFDADWVTTARVTSRAAQTAALSTNILRNTIDGGGNGTAIEADVFGTETLTMTAAENFITNCAAGFDFYNEPTATLLASVHNNSITGCTAGSANNSTTTPDLSGNWWGDATPTGVASLMASNLDYTPWLASGSDTDPLTPGFQGDYSVLWVDDDSPQSGASGYIEEGMALVSGSTVNIAGGAYSESIVFGSSFAKNDLSLVGEAGDQPQIAGGVRFLNTGALSAISFDNLYLSGLAAGANMVFDMDNSGAVSGLSLNGCVIDGENISGRTGFGGQALTGDVSITNSEFKDILGWAVMDISSGSGDGGNSLPLTSVTFSGNNVHHCNGSVALRGNASTRTGLVTVADNTFTAIGGNQAEQGEQWAAFEINHADVADISGNVVDTVLEGVWGEGQAAQLWDIGTLDMYNNAFTNCFQGVYYFGGGGVYGGPYAIPGGSTQDNTFAGNTQYNLSVSAVATGGPLNAEGNYWGDVTCPGVTATIDGNADYDPWCNSDFTRCDFTCSITEVWVDDDYCDGCANDGHVWQYDAYDNINDAMNNVVGSTIHLLPGTYHETLNITLNDLAIIGTDRNTVIIDASGLATNNAGIYVNNGVNNVTLQSFTLVGGAPGTLPRYGIKLGDGDGCTLSDLLVYNCYRTGIDVLGASNLTITDVESRDNGGNGLQTGDANGVTFNNITTSNNAWGGVGIFTYGRYTPLGTSGIVFTGTNSFGETSSDVGGLYLEEGNYNDPPNPEQITYSTNIADGADVTVQLADFTHTLHGISDNDNNYVRFYATLSDARSAAAGTVSHILGDRYIMELAGTHLYVPGNLGGIQAAIDAASVYDMIQVDPGLYAERVIIAKPLTVQGATAAANKNGYTVPASYAWDTNVESVISNPDPALATSNVVDITNTDDVVFEGFVVQSLNALASSSNDHLVRIYAQSQAMNNIVVRNNVIGPNTNVVSQDGTHGRMGLYLALPNYSNYDILNSTFSGNKIFDCQGNGNNVFVWGGAEAYSASERGQLTGTVIEDNEIYGSHRSGIEMAGSCDDLVIRGNTIYGQSGLPGDDPNNLKYGNGILVIRMGADKASSTAEGPNNLVIENNEIYGNEKNGIYFGPMNTNHQLTGNDIHDNGWDGIRADLTEQYYGGAWPALDQMTNIAAHANRISGNALGVQVVGAPTNAFVLDAESNYWGAVDCPTVAAAIAGAVDFEPWCNADFSRCDLTCDLEEVWVDDDYCEGCANDGHTWGYDAFDIIQDGVDAVNGSIVHVAAGLYVEQVDIGKNLLLTGAGPSAIIRSPDVLAAKFTTSSAKKPIVYVHDVDSVQIEFVQIDGAGKGNANYQFIGIAFRNAGGQVNNVEITDVRDTPFSGSQHGVAIYAYNDDGTGRDITVATCNIHDFQKNAMALNAAATTPLNVSVHDNVVTGYGATTVTAQNGIQVWADLGTGSVVDNTVSGIAYDNTDAATKWVATSILNYYGDLDITGNTVSGAHVGIYNIDGAGTIAGNTLAIEKVGVFAWGIIGTDPPQAVASPYTELDNTEDSEIRAPVRSASTAATLDVQLLQNTVTFTGPDNTTTFGIEADAGYGPDNLAVVASENLISGFEVGIEFYSCESSCDVGVFTSASATGNSLAGNTIGMRSNIPGMTVDGSGNWWGDNTAAAVAGSVSGDIDYTPWLDVGTDSEPGTAGFQGDYSVLWVDDSSPQIGSVSRINEGVEMVTGSTVHVVAGTYHENIVIDKSLDLIGEDAALVTIYPALSDVGPTTGPSFTGSQLIVVQADDVSISDLTLDGDSPDLTPIGTLDARNGIITNYGAGNWNNMAVTDCVVKNCYLRGIYASAASHSTGHAFRNNTVDNVIGVSMQSAGIMFWGATGEAVENAISNASLGIFFQSGSDGRADSNTVATCELGVGANNNAAATSLSYNMITSCGSAGGIQLVMPRFETDVAHNSLASCTTGITIYGGELAHTQNIRDNTIAGAGIVNSTGIYASTDISPYGYAPVSALLRRNTVHDNGYGVILAENPSHMSEVMDVTISGAAPDADSLYDNAVQELLLQDCNDDINAQFTYWGVMDCDSIESRIFHQPDHAGLGLVDYSNALCSGCPVEMTGDVNEDGAYTSADIIYLVNFVFKSGPAPLPVVEAGDVNCSGDVTSADVIYLVNLVFKSGPLPCDVCTIL